MGRACCGARDLWSGAGCGAACWTRTGKIKAHKDVPVLILRTCEYVTLHGKRDFANVIKDLDMEKLSQIIQMGPL